ncbi:unnamed protein product [Rotaria sordida]|uniref:TM2 domain-containing protein n=1 Tax=Rotaria sordida TaxID=392033 RepID=A0A815CTD6_9BILA|nr:unnamed protein product [Rotaria sordida]CAF1220751.1 unnamed protein product [Rotaria sordida]CAF1221076.1 unnamed protein product [Rotaria sordida]CAF1221877.1 unnamed protein product [Rotaria sordida]CAF1287106.1 unnamed protein product [Rotaria sordida]
MLNVNSILLIFIQVFNLIHSQCNINGLISCNQVPVECLDCILTTNCIYGEELLSSCRMFNGSCTNNDNKIVSSFQRLYICRYCYQTPLDELACTPNIACRHHQNSNRYKSNCTLADDTQLCLGSRTFYRNIECNWTSGHKKSNALLISIFFGGLGFDRFYLGHIKEALGKIFSFGGLGIWTLIDSVLIACGYLTPDDGSVYME